MYVICYDISSDRLRTKVSELLEGYGRRVQYSIFECRITEKQFARLKEKLIDLMSGSSDAGIVIYHLCGKCEKKVQTIGEDKTKNKMDFDDLIII